MTKCRVELQHQDPNGTKRISIGTTCSEHEVAYSILNLPQCCLKLEDLHITVPVNVSTLDLSSCTKLSHATGFMLEYSETKWDNWFSSYCQHSNTRYSIHTGNQINKKQEHGTIHLYEENFTFKIEWSRMYNCFRAGKGRLKSENSNPFKRRNAPGSHCCECPASVNCCLLLLSNHCHILEMQLPLHSVHKNHDPLSIADQLCNRPHPEIEKKVEELVSDTRLSALSLKLVIDNWVAKVLIPKQLEEGIIEEVPQPFNRAYFPTKKDLCNMSHKAIVKRRNSLFDQDVLNKLLKDKAKSSGLLYLFQKYSQTEIEKESCKPW